MNNEQPPIFRMILITDLLTQIFRYDEIAKVEPPLEWAQKIWKSYDLLSRHTLRDN